MIVFVNTKYYIIDGYDYVKSYETMLVFASYYYSIWVTLYSFTAYLVNIKRKFYNLKSFCPVRHNRNSFDILIIKKIC